MYKIKVTAGRFDYTFSIPDTSIIKAIEEVNTICNSNKLPGCASGFMITSVKLIIPKKS